MKEIEGLKHENIEANGINFHYVTAGEGPLVLMLHGFPEFWYSWRHQIPLLAKKYKVVVPDMRGYNETDKPRGVKNYSLDVLIEDVRCLAEKLKGSDEKFILMAHDWGGVIAWEFAHKHPDMLEKLIILNAPHLTIYNKHIRRPRQLLSSYYIFLFQIPGLAEFGLSRRGNMGVARLLKTTAVNKDAFSDEDLDAFREAFNKPYALTSAINYYRALFRGGRQMMKNRPKNRIPCSTLVIWGEQDVALTKELTYDMNKFVSGDFDIKYIPESGHWVQQEAAETVNSYLKEFLLQ